MRSFKTWFPQNIQFVCKKTVIIFYLLSNIHVISPFIIPKLFNPVKVEHQVCSYSEHPVLSFDVLTQPRKGVL